MAEDNIIPEFDGNDRPPLSPRHCERQRSNPAFGAPEKESWIASSQVLLAMTDKAGLAEQSR